MTALILDVISLYDFQSQSNSRVFFVTHVNSIKIEVYTRLYHPQGSGLARLRGSTASNLDLRNSLRGGHSDKVLSKIMQLRADNSRPACEGRIQRVYFTVQ